MHNTRWIKQWLVPSLSSDREYKVSQDYNGDWACSCRGWTQHYPRVDCKHIRFIKNGDGKGFTLGEAMVRKLAGRETTKLEFTSIFPRGGI